MSETDAIQIAKEVAAKEGLEPAIVEKAVFISHDDPFRGVTDNDRWFVYFHFTLPESERKTEVSHPPVVVIDCLTREATLHLGM